MRISGCILRIAAFLPFLFSATAEAGNNPANFAPFPPFQIMDKLYYVGSANLGSYVIKTSAGLILVNTGYDKNTPMIEESVEKIGFHMKDVKILLISHAHIDHAGGAGGIIKLTGAKYEVMAGDVDVVESGGKMDYHYGDKPEEYYVPTHVDRILHDMDIVKLGDTILTAHITPGHTKGDTTWTFDVNDGGRIRKVVIVGGPLLNKGMKMVDNPRYPNISEDYRKTFATLRALPVDIFVGAHGYYFDLPTKYAKWISGDKDAFVDPKGYYKFIDDAEKSFEAALSKQESGAP